MIGGIVFETLQGLVDGRCYPNTFPQGRTPTWPAIRYIVTDSLPTPDVCGTDLGETDETRVQVDCVALTYGAVIILRDQVIVAMQNPLCIREGMFETYDSETKTHRVVIEFTFHPSSVASS